MSRMVISDEQCNLANEMRLAGRPWQAIEISLGINWESLRRKMRSRGHEMQGKLGKVPVRKLAAPAHEIRFHVMRLGNRKRVAELYGVGYVTVYQALPLEQVDLYQRGQMVNIGGIMCKKCLICGTARELEHFWANPSAKSGCRETCYFCRVRMAEEKLAEKQAVI